MLLRRWIRIAGRAAAALLAVGVAGAIAFDLLGAGPPLAQVDRMLADASPSERRPPAALVDMLHRAYGDQLAWPVARQAVLTDEVGRRRLLHRQFVELGVALLLPLHFSPGDIETAFLASTPMGPGTRGFAAASQRHLGVPLASVDAAQSARLVAISWAPSWSLGSPERLERRVRHLRALAPGGGQ